MSAGASRTSRAETTDRSGAIVVLVVPVLIWAASWIQQPTFHRFYREVLPMFYPSVAVMWVFALLQVFWPDRVPPPVPPDASHLRIARWIRTLLYGVSGAIFLGYIALTSGPNRPVGIVMLATLSCGLAVQTYIQHRKLPAGKLSPPS